MGEDLNKGAMLLLQDILQTDFQGTPRTLLAVSQLAGLRDSLRNALYTGLHRRLRGGLNYWQGDNGRERSATWERA